MLKKVEWSLKLPKNVGKWKKTTRFLAKEDDFEHSRIASVEKK